MAESEIILSLCLSGRNDHYGHDFQRRFVQAMEFLAWSAERAGVLDRLEVLFTDWNSAIPLTQIIHLSPPAAKMLRFITVPPAVAEKYNSDLAPFQQSIAFNVALRRARGRFAGIMPADILIQQHSLRNLLAILEGAIATSHDWRQAIIAVPRKNLPFFTQEQDYFSSPEQIEALLLAGDSYMLFDNRSRGLMGGYGIFISSRELLDDLRGVDERIAGWGYNDIDLALRCADRAPVINTNGYGIKCYDFEPNPRAVTQKEQKRAPVLPIGLGKAENTPEWGLSQYDFASEPARGEGNTDAARQSPCCPAEVSCREWLLWLSQRISAFSVPCFSAPALAAAYLARRTPPRRVLLYGSGDRSIAAALSLVCPLAELTICELFCDNQSFYRIWHDDAVLGSLHWQGQVHYWPANTIVDRHPFDLIIITTSVPTESTLQQNSSAASSIIFSSSGLAGWGGQSDALCSASRRCFKLPGLTIFSSVDLSLAKLRQECRPLDGNIFGKILLLIRPYASKLVKLGNLLLRTPLRDWPLLYRLLRRFLPRRPNRPST